MSPVGSASLVAGWSDVIHWERKESVCSRGAQTMRRPRKPTPPTTEAIDQFCAFFDDLFGRFEERRALRQYLIGLLLPREHNKTLVELASIVPGANRQPLHHFWQEAPWEGEALTRRRLERWKAHP